MRVLHLCLANFYIDGYNYQENVLPRLAKEQGNDVMIIASTETFIDNNRLGYIVPKRYVTEYGVPIKRLPYKKIISEYLTHKIRKYVGLYAEIERFCPDIIFSHGVSYISLNEVVGYKVKHPAVKLIVDTHSAWYNSGTNWLSKNILHGLFYKRIVQHALPYIDKFYYTGLAECDFSEKIYGVPLEKMEYYPLGGIIPSDDEKERKRKQYRNELRMNDDELLFIHSGKMSRKKKTKELLEAFAKVPQLKARLILIGNIPEETMLDVKELMKADSRVMFLGWKEKDELLGWLCACDLYCQPGGPSATMQNAICCGAAIMARPDIGYELLDRGNFWWVSEEGDIVRLFKDIQKGTVDLDEKKSMSMICAAELLDYKMLEKKIYE